MQHQQHRNTIDVFVRYVLRTLTGALAGGIVGGGLGVVVTVVIVLVSGLTAEGAAAEEFARWWPVSILAATIIGGICGGGGGLCGGATGALSRAWVRRSAAIALGASISCLVVLVVVLSGTFGGAGSSLLETLAFLVPLSLAAAVGGAVGSSTVRP